MSNHFEPLFVLLFFVLNTEIENKLLILFDLIFFFQGIQATCNIPLEFHGIYYSVDIPPYDRIVIQSTLIRLQDTGDDESATSENIIEYDCQSELSRETYSGVAKYIRLQLENM